MVVNYHTHTARCRHATGEEIEYVRAALEAGMEALGFSDHTPYWFHADYYSRFRMFPEQLQDYVNQVLRLRDEFQGKIEIRLGLEAEFYPAFFPELLERLKDTPVEYLLLGQHYVGNELGDWYSGKATADPDILRRYTKQVCDAMQTGLFSYLAHPELIHFVGDEGLYKEQMRVLCREAKGCGMPLEINLLGIREGRHYPDGRFWEIAGEEGCPAVLGCDAHEPAVLKDTATERRARMIAEKYGLQIIERPVMRWL